MKVRLLSLFILLMPFAGIRSQEVYINPADPAFRARYGEVEFGDRFSLVAVSDAGNNYYLVDFTKLPSRFEKVYFLNLTYKSDRVVCIDSDLTQDRLWFSAPKERKESDVTDYFLDLKKKTLKASSVYSGEEKMQYLNKNDKLK